MIKRSIGSMTMALALSLGMMTAVTAKAGDEEAGSAAEVAPIDDSVALTFYLPFEGTMEAAYARGTTLPYENAYANKYVDGVLGTAAYFGRTPGPQPETGWMQYAIGGSYQDALNVSRERGTIELWFRPNREMLETSSKWKKFYLWSVYRETGPGIYFEPKEDGALTLTLSQTFLTSLYPSADRMAHTEEASCNVPTDDSFFGQWHHLAFVYDGTLSNVLRQVYLDGAKVIDMKMASETLNALQDPFSEQPCMIGKDLNVGWAGRWAPYTPCCDLDEFKIYDGVRYRDDFTPQRPAAPAVTAVKVDGNQPLAAVPELLTDGTMRLEDNRIVLPLAAGADKFDLAVEIRDGLPLIVSSKGIKLGLKDLVEEDPEIKALTLSSLERIAPDTVRFELARYGIDATLRVVRKGDRLRLSLSMTNNGTFWRAPLEARVSIRKTDGSAWNGMFDGQCNRSLTVPFMPSCAEGIANIFPVSGVWDDRMGIALAFDPTMIVSYLRQGIDTPDEFSSACRPVLDPGQSSTTELDLYTFDSRYQGDDAVARYHARYPEIFAPDPNVDPRIQKGCAQYLTSTTLWSPSVRKESKIATFSAQELCRRANLGWEWFYGTGGSAGDWTHEPFLREVLPAYKGKFGGGEDSATLNKNLGNSFRIIDSYGVATGYYILTWMERRYARYFKGSLISPFDVERSPGYINNWWTKGMRDYVFMPSWTRAGDFMRKQITEIAQNQPDVSTFCYDVAEGDHRDYADRPKAGAARAFDRKGAYTSYLAGMGAFCDFIRSQKRADGKQLGIIGNPHLWNTAFPVLFRMDSRIWEGRYFECMSNENIWQQNNRFFGAKHICLFMADTSNLTGNYYPEPEKQDVARLRLEMVAVKMQCFLRAFLNNAWMSPPLVYGTKEIAEGQQDLARTLESGFNVVSAASVASPLGVARYGKPSKGVYAIVNPAFDPQKSALTVDCDYLKAVPVLAMDRRESLKSQATARELTVEGLALKGLDYQLLDAVASLTGLSPDAAVSIDAGLSRSPSERTVRISLNAAKPEKATLTVGLAPDETLVKASLNGKALEMNADTDGDAVNAELALNGKTELAFDVKNTTWLSPASEVTAFPFIAKTGPSARLLYAEEGAKSEAIRVREYFSFWTRNADGWKPVFIKPEAGTAEEAGKDQPLVCLSLKAPAGQEASEGILREGDVLQVWAPNAERLQAMTGVLFAALDTVYPYVGKYGCQRIVSEYDECSTGDQRALLKAADLPGNNFSVQELLQAVKP